ncbi:hypothetical protein SAMN05428985_11080 [Nocardioides sp. YR527]|uniref:hypothetical protein n=1 Tax=Nocardioides sp. YR527 TaxID=1881028 RepID=UPI00088AE04B|nr:hypothetical protein [Nocardioides sp. YR527]SDL15284.1 hypothetical protein SAMN05428985_11080 [Nocardioides sp. YR527]
MSLTPGQVQQRLFDVHQELGAAARAVADARNAEVHAIEALTMAKARAILSEECPRPKRGENGVTVADRDAWVDQATSDERFDAAVKEQVRKAAEDRLRVVRDQASVVQSLSALMRAEMSLGAGVGA